MGKKTLILINGAKDHGVGEHDYPAGMRILHRALKEYRPDWEIIQAQQKAPFDGWPSDKAPLDRADAVVIYSGGSGGNPIRWHWDELSTFCSRGGGLACIHYAIEVINGDQNDRLMGWIGGAYENMYSTNPDWLADVTIRQGHPIARGVKPFRLKDEYYFNIRFPDDRTGWTSIAETVPPDEVRQFNSLPHIMAATGRSETILWSLERPDGGRGFGFSGGHWHSLWAHEDYRKLVLNAILWLAKEDVPPGGMPSRAPTVDEMKGTPSSQESIQS